VKGKDNYQTVNYDPGQPITVAVPWEKSHHTHLPQTGKSTMFQKKSEHVKVEAYYYINWMDPKSGVQMFLGAQQKCNKKTTSSIFGG